MAESFAEMVLKSIFMVIFMVMAIVGNLVVCIAIKTNSRLRSLTNYYVFNLAVADFLFGITGMPMLLVTTIARGWILGPVLCQISGTLTTLFVLTSIWTLTLIGVNRYFAVGRATSYKSIYRKKRVLGSIFAVWALAALVAIAPQMGWSRITKGDNFCTIDGRKHISYSILVITLAYIAPLIILVCLYLKIFFVLREHEKSMAALRGGSMISRGYSEADFETGSADYSSSYKTENMKNLTLPRGESRRENTLDATTSRAEFSRQESTEANLNNTGDVDQDGGMVNSDHNKNDDTLTDPDTVDVEVVAEGACGDFTVANDDKLPSVDEPNTLPVSPSTETRDTRSASDSKVKLIIGKGDTPTVAFNSPAEEKNSNGTAKPKSKQGRTLGGFAHGVRNRKSRTSKKIKKFIMEARLTRMLFVVVAFFFICWTPLVLGTILYAFNAEPKNFNLLSMGFVMACMNSICNPIIYAFMNKLFRTAFKELLRNLARKCGCMKNNS